MAENDRASHRLSYTERYGRCSLRQRLSGFSSNYLNRNIMVLDKAQNLYFTEVELSGAIKTEVPAFSCIKQWQQNCSGTISSQSEKEGGKKIKFQVDMQKIGYRNLEGHLCIGLNILAVCLEEFGLWGEGRARTGSAPRWAPLSSPDLTAGSRNLELDPKADFPKKQIINQTLLTSLHQRKYHICSICLVSLRSVLLALHVTPNLCCLISKCLFACVFSFLRSTCFYKCLRRFEFKILTWFHCKERLHIWATANWTNIHPVSRSLNHRPHLKLN